MANDLNIRIKINSDTKALEVTQDGFEKIRKKAGEAGEPIDKLSSGMSNLADNVKSVAAAYASLSVIDKFISAGFEYNKTMEQQIAGMQRVIVATSQDVSARGKQLTLMEKYTYAAREAHTAVADLESINAQTPHTLTQTIQIYNAMYTSMKRAGASNEEMIRLTKEISMATSNLDFNSVLAGVDGLATGTVEVSSDFGRFAAALGLTNEELKKTDNVAELVHKKLWQMTLSANTMDEATSNMTNSWEKFAGKATEPLFDVIKEDIKDVTKAMEENNQTLLDFVYFLSLPVAGAHLLVNSFRVAFNTIPLYFDDASLAIKRAWIELLFEIQKSARDVLPERVSGALGFDAKSIAANKSALANIAAEKSKLAAQVIKEQELLNKTANAYYNINVPKKVAAAKNGDQLLPNPKGQSEEEKKAAEQAAKKAAAAHEKALKEKLQKEKEYAASIQSLNDAGFAFAQENIEKEKKALEDKTSAEKAMYASLNDLSDDWYTNESVRIGEQYNEWEKAGADHIKLEEWLNASILKLGKKRFDEERDLNQKRLEEENTFWYDLLGDFEKSMENQIFDAMTNKWQSFGDWLKDFWSSITTSIARAASSQLSKGIIDEVKNLAGLGSNGSASSNIVGTFKTLLAGGALAGSAMYGATTDSAGFTTTAGGTVLNSAGQIIKVGTDNLGQVGDIVNGISTIKTAYEAMTGELSASIYSAINSASMNLYGSGILSLDSAVSLNNFGYGITNPWAMSGANGAAGYGAMAGGAALGAAGGYALGSLGDMLFGANTKAGSYGAIGGAIGSFAGPIGAIAGAALGSLIGGMFGGTTKEIDSGLYFQNDTTSTKDLNSIENYLDTEKKSWFGDGAKSKYEEITDSQKKSIEGIFKSYDYLLTQLGSTKNIVLKASRYTAETFQDEIAKGFIATYMGIEQHASEYLYSRNGVVFKKYNDTEEMTKIYNMWSEYAKSVDKTVMQALSDSVNTYIQSNRDFTIWELERSGNTTEALRQKAQWLQDDFANLENMMGVTGITVNNFTSMYSDAVKNSLDPTTITQWQSLGSALQSATDAQDAYTKSLQDTALNGFNQLSSAYSTFSNGINEVQGYLDQLNGSVITFDQAGDDPAKIMQAYQAQADQITQISNNRISALQKELDYSKTLLKVASDLRYSAMSGTSQFTYTDTMLNQYISDATTKLASGKDISSEVQNISSLAGNYAQLAQNYYSDQAGFDYAMSSMANKIEALGGKGSTSTLSDIETAINMENDSLSTELKALKDEASSRLQSVIEAYSTGQQLIADQMQSQLDNYAEFWGVDSPIVAKLQEILQSLGLQYSLNTSGTGPSSVSAITDAYQNILGRTPDTAGADYWTSKIDSGILNSSEAGIAIGAAAATNGEISVSQYITDLYTQGLGRTPDASGIEYWNNVVSSGQLSIDQLASTFSSAAGSNGESFHKFKDGGLVKGGKGGIIGQIGEEDYDELILPLKDPNDPLGLKSLRSDSLMMRQSDPMIALLGTIVTLLEKLGYDMNSVLDNISDNTKQSRRA